MIDDPSTELVNDFRQLHEDLARTSDVAKAQQRLVELACSIVAGCDWAAITTWPTRQKPRTVARTAEVSQQVDEVQYAAGEGPCLSAAAGDDAVWIPDLRAERRWPAFVHGALTKTPVRSVLSYHLTWEPARSALNLYAGAPDALGQEDFTTGELFANHAAVLMSHADSAQEAVHLQQALSNSRQIGAAIGILMQTHRVTEDTAFAMLRAVSNRLNRKVKDVANDVVQTGELPHGHQQ